MTERWGSRTQQLEEAAEDLSTVANLLTPGHRVFRAA